MDNIKIQDADIDEVIVDKDYESEEIDTVDNSDISYDKKKIFIKLNASRNWYEKSRNRLDSSLRNLRKLYPALFNGCEENEELEFLFENVFTEGIETTFYVTNLTFETSKDKKEILSIRPLKEGVYLNESLPKNLTPIFKGHLDAGFFIVDEITIGVDSERRDCEVELIGQPFYTSGSREHREPIFKEILENAASLTAYTEEKLIEWEEFISWRKEITKKKILGAKYFKVECAEYKYDRKKFVTNFYMVFEDENEFKAFKKYLRRDIKVFNNSYSTDPLRFKFSYDERTRNYGNGIEIGRFRTIADSYYLKDKLKTTPHKEAALELEDDAYNNFEDININEYDRYQDNNNSNNNISQDVEVSEYILLENFENPYIVIVSYDLKNEYQDEIREAYLSQEEQKAYIEENVLSDFNKQGFLALSGVGEFALLRRFDMAIKQLKRDESYAPNLALWLFNIDQARLPDEQSLIKVEEWLNDGIKNNEGQRQAVEKMLNTPDISLVQGPPGTGKTTVIAEAIYQFAIRGQRVLVASQSNDAVDNALERLAETPVIRAIRLGQKNRKKKLSEENLLNKFSEENAIETFYKSISNKLDNDYISNWKAEEQQVIDCSVHIRDCKAFQEQLKALSDNRDSNSIDFTKISNTISQINRKIKSIKDNNINSERTSQQVHAFENFLNELHGSFTLPENLINTIFDDINKPLNNLFDIGFDLMGGLSLDTSNLDVINKNRILQVIINNLKVLDGLHTKMENSNSNAKSDIDTSVIDKRIKLLYDEMGSTTDDTKLLAIAKEINSLNSEKNNKLSKKSSIGLTELEKDLLTNSFKNTIKKNSGFDDNKLKASLKESECIRREIYSILINFAEKTLDKLTDRIEDTTSLEREVEANIGKRKIIEEDLKTITNKINSINEELKNIANIYEVTDLNNLINTIEETKNNTTKTINDNKEFKDLFGDLITNFKNKLDDKNNYKYDKQYYEDIYINACNVVGISCTDNMRSLTDRGYQDFDVVIIDEVSKATPPELLIPLMKAKKAVLVGDHRQLPPLFNEHEKSYKEIINSISDEDDDVRELFTSDNFHRFKNMVTASLFKDYFERADESIKHSLFTQYRMHSDIMNIINRFYNGRLCNGLDEATEDKIKDHGVTINGVDGTKFITPDKHAYWLDSSRLPNHEKFYESRPEGSTSAENILECFMIIELLKKLATEYKAKGFNKNNQKTVGVISFYQLQVNRLRSMIATERKKYNFDFSAINIDINTVDRFQGKEKQIIITSLVRNLKNYKRNEESHIAAFERINVAFSRAQEMLVIVGAKDMYAEQPVKLPNMDSVGEKTVYVYKNIIEELHRKACFFGSNKLLSKEASKEIEDFKIKEYK